MARTIVYTCNFCNSKMNQGDGMAFLYSAGQYHRSDRWEDCGSHLCRSCTKFFDGDRTAVLTTALKQCINVIEKGIEARIGDQWPVLKDMLPDALVVAKKALQ